MFDLGDCYTRQEVHALIGGSVQSYLPTVKKRVVAGFFNPVFDPDAPRIVLAGRGPIIQGTADQLTQQADAVPTFVKRRVNCWEYVGRYRVVRQTYDQAEILPYAHKAKRVGDVTSVLFLQSAD